jgi:hypothetical protein
MGVVGERLPFLERVLPQDAGFNGENERRVLGHL